MTTLQPIQIRELETSCLPSPGANESLRNSELKQVLIISLHSSVLSPAAKKQVVRLEQRYDI
jgi:hypothetical protein